MVFFNELFLILACESGILDDGAVSLFVTLWSEIDLDALIESDPGRLGLLLIHVIDLFVDSLLVLVGDRHSGILGTLHHDVCAVEIFLSLFNKIVCTCLAVAAV